MSRRDLDRLRDVVDNATAGRAFGTPIVALLVARSVFQARADQLALRGRMAKARRPRRR